MECLLYATPISKFGLIHVFLSIWTATGARRRGPEYAQPNPKFRIFAAMKTTLPPLKGKRIAALDYGTKRIGVAVTDELHITISPREIIAADAPDLWDVVRRLVVFDRLGALVVGVPVREDGTKSAIVKKIEKFIEELRGQIEIPVIEYDESFSTQAAFQTMIAGGMKKKQRQQKGTKDKIAAAVILRDFLQDFEREIY